jgi:hypothetical protein
MRRRNDRPFGEVVQPAAGGARTFDASDPSRFLPSVTNQEGASRPDVGGGADSEVRRA